MPPPPHPPVSSLDPATPHAHLDGSASRAARTACTIWKSCSSVTLLLLDASFWDRLGPRLSLYRVDTLRSLRGGQARGGQEG